MSLLLLSEQQSIKPISSNNEDKYALLAEEVESYELSKLLTPVFLQDIQAYPTSEKYANLLGEHAFVDEKGNTLKHRGLKYVIAYLNFAKYVGESYISDTFSGFVRKTRADSESLSVGDIKRIQQENKEIAFNAFELIRIFLNNNKEIYPLWNQSKEVRISKPKFYGIKKTHG